MNRRSFLASIPLLPAAAKAVIARPTEPIILDLDAIFATLYAVRGNKNAHIEMWAYGEDGAAALAAIKRYYQPGA